MQLLARSVSYSSTSLSTENNTQLCYRGAKYLPMIAMIPSIPNHIQLSYRGSKYFPGSDQQNTQVTTQKLTYRGTTYER